MSYKANYFKIGLFIVVGTAIVLATAIGLGTTALFGETVTVETYFDESVQGLSVGSPVKYRGVQVGNVERILFTYNKYEQDLPFARRKPYVLVEFGVAPEGFGGNPRRGAAVLDDMVERGLRVRLAQQGLTGLCYLELDVLRDTEQQAALDVPWPTPPFYIPSQPSAFAQLNESLDSVVSTAKEIEAVPFDQIGEQISELLTALNKLTQDEQLAEAIRESASLLREGAAVARRVRELVEAPEMQEVPGDLAGTVRRSRELLDSVNGSLPGALEDMRSAVKTVEAVAAKVDAALAENRLGAGLDDAAAGAADLKEAAEKLPELVADLRATLRTAKQAIELREQDVDALLRNLRRTAENLSRLTDDAVRNPSRVLFGDPPPPYDGDAP